jgi:glycosyltransferase involved in cell wall biosynthesis
MSGLPPVPKLSIDDVACVYGGMRAAGRQHLTRRAPLRTLQFVRAAARTAYIFNWVYADAELEDQVRGISQQLLPRVRIAAVKGHVVFYDCFALDNRGLTQQYLRALITAGYDVLFIFERENVSQSRAIRRELDECAQCQVYSVDHSLPPDQWMKATHSRICEFAPDKILMHLTPWAVEALAILHAVDGPTKYQINLTDHAFWLGAEFLDYSLEFRDYGCTVSTQRRGLRADQLLLHPYYPITADVPFQGFPPQAKGRVVILSGASFYKIYGRDDCFLRMAQRLLAENASAVLLFAGSGEGTRLPQFIAEHGLQDRFILIGERSDISQAIAHADIYLSTFPITGGLMSQLAAAHAKPILAFTTPDIPCNFVEGIVCHKASARVTCTTEADFFQEARRLVSDEVYRASRGKEMHEAMRSATDFNESIGVLESRRSPRPFHVEPIDYRAFSDVYVEVENAYQDPFKRLALGTFGLRGFITWPRIFSKILAGLLANRFAAILHRA